MRSDFVISGGDAPETVLEVKTVVDASLDAGMTTSSTDAVAGLFPWGKRAARAASKFVGPGLCYGLGFATAFKTTTPTCPRLPKSSKNGRRLFELGRTRRCNQKGPDGEKVVSARAIKHVDALATIQREGVSRGAVLFVVARNDATSFRPHAERCPSFAAHLSAAKGSGVTIVARRLRWEVADGVAEAHDGGAVPVELP